VIIGVVVMALVFVKRWRRRRADAGGA